MNIAMVSKMNRTGPIRSPRGQTVGPVTEEMEYTLEEILAEFGAGPDKSSDTSAAPPSTGLSAESDTLPGKSDTLPGKSDACSPEHPDAVTDTSETLMIVPIDPESIQIDPAETESEPISPAVESEPISPTDVESGEITPADEPADVQSGEIEPIDPPSVSMDNAVQSDPVIPAQPGDIAHPGDVAPSGDVAQDVAQSGNVAQDVAPSGDIAQPGDIAQDVAQSGDLARTGDTPHELQEPVTLPRDWRPKRFLFSHQRVENPGKSFDAMRPDEPEHAEVIAPEPRLKEVAERFRAEYNSRMRDFSKVLPAALLPVMTLLLERVGMHIPLLSENLSLRGFLLLICLMVTGIFSRQILVRPRCPAAIMCGIAAVVCAADCVVQLAVDSRAAVEPYGAVACLAVMIAKWGVGLDSRGMFDTFRTAALDSDPPYLVTDTEKGACKQRGAVPGFYTAAMRRDYSAVWQLFILPLVLAASVIFAALSSIARDRPADFFLNWSAILCAGATLTLPLCWGLPWARLAARLNKAGCAVAGWNGAERISRRKKMILADGDLFPPGSVQLNGMKIYHDNVERVVSLAAAMARASGSGLDRVFDDLRRSELGHCPDVEDFRFYQEGGFSARIEGETVLFGTDAFLRRMGLNPPDELHLHTGMFLAADGELLAAFALRYQANENVDYALKMMRRSHVTAILASRDPNITPALLHKKFHRKIKVEYPTLSARVELSEASEDRDLPRGILLREGLLPYAEAVTGSRRMCRGVRRATRLALFGSVMGTLLAFYLVYQSRYNLLTPLTLLLFLVLWAIPELLLMELI